MTSKLTLLATLALASCGHTQHPSLADVLAKVDVPTLLRCAQEDDWAERAKCVGAQAATVGLRFAFDQAVKLAERAQEAAGPSGADDMTDAQRQALAADLDAALDQLGTEVAKAQGDGSTL